MAHKAVPRVPADKIPSPLRTLVLTPHDPITIDGDAGFLGLNTSTGISQGSGTASDPYVIEGWDINTTFGVGIFITDSHVYFRISGCSIHDTTYAGIYLLNADNGTVIGNDCSDGYNGIYVGGSNNTLSDNICLNNDFRGIFISGSDNFASNNTCSMNMRGIEVGAIRIELSNNNCSYNEIGIGIYSSSNIIASNNTCLSNDYGIYLTRAGPVESNSTRLLDNSCSSNAEDGIYVYYSSNNTLLRNTCALNIKYGLRISDTYSSGNEMWDNTFVGNNGAGTTYDSNHIQAYDGGTDNWWNSTEGYGNYWSDWTTPDVAPQDGVVDVPYEIAGTAGAKDYYPLTTTQTLIPEFGMMPLVVMGLLMIIVLMGEAGRRKAR